MPPPANALFPASEAILMMCPPCARSFRARPPCSAETPLSNWYPVQRPNFLRTLHEWARNIRFLRCSPEFRLAPASARFSSPAARYPPGSIMSAGIANTLLPSRSQFRSRRLAVRCHRARTGTLRAHLRQAVRDRQPDAAARSGHQRDFALDSVSRIIHRLTLARRHVSLSAPSYHLGFGHRGWARVAM